MQHSPEFSSARALQDHMAGVTFRTPDTRGSIVDMDAVDRVMVVEDVLKIMENASETLGGRQSDIYPIRFNASLPFRLPICISSIDGPFPFVVYGFLTSFPVDHVDESAFMLRRCIGCKKRVRNLDQRACEDCAQRNHGSSGLYQLV